MLAAEFFDKAYNSGNRGTSIQETSAKNCVLNFDDGDPSSIPASLGIVTDRRTEHVEINSFPEEKVPTVSSTKENALAKMAGLSLPIGNVNPGGRFSPGTKLDSNGIHDLQVTKPGSLYPFVQELSTESENYAAIQGKSIPVTSSPSLRWQMYSENGITETDSDRTNVLSYERKIPEWLDAKKINDEDSFSENTNVCLRKRDAKGRYLATDTGYTRDYEDRSMQEKESIQNSRTRRQDIRGAVRKKNYEKISRDNEFLKKTIVQLEVDILDLKDSLSKAHHCINQLGTDKKNHLKKASRTNSPFLQAPNVSLEASNIISNGSDVMPLGKLEAVGDETQRHESTQCVEGLLRELENSKFKEGNSKEKLESLQIRLDQTQSIYSETMKTALQSANDMYLKVERLKKDIFWIDDNSFDDFTWTRKLNMGAPLECARLYEEGAQDESLVKTPNGGFDEKAHSRTGRKLIPHEEMKKLMIVETDEKCNDKATHNETENSSFSKINSNTDSGWGSIDGDGSNNSSKRVNHGCVSPKPPKYFGNNETGSLDRQASIRLISRDDILHRIDAATEKQRYDVVKTCSNSKETESAKLREGNISSHDTGDEAPLRSSYPDLSSSSWSGENKQSYLSNSKHTSQSSEENNATKQRAKSTKVPSLSIEENGKTHVERSSSSEMINKLMLSKKRLQRADQKLNALVKEAALLNSIPQPEVPRLDNSIEVADNHDGSIEVSHLSYTHI
ncbi:unnamed protein product [Pseudo-nitzschia multistriata]|uniref:Uncharacterized protein n=1 Tax=Pseudo-nitzschia multistriata TaxID=183589 RepID=A0A448ZFW3_9STRA|nr:unnamed protein product [Pseudo-nitzschia multistriata]